MSEKQIRLIELLNGYAEKTLTKSVENELFELLDTTDEAEVEPLLMEILETSEPIADPVRRARLLDQVFKAAPVRQLPKKDAGGFRKWMIAASIILVAGVAALLYVNRQKGGSKQEIASHDVKAPATNRAMITLADGRMVFLDSVSNGTLATEGSINLVKLADGKISYQGAGTGAGQYNTLYNPRGSKVVSLILSDGTKVWLNSESKLTYPVSFSGAERQVEISGEAYFSVTHNAQQPFRVNAGGITVEDIGTEFNVNAYTDEDGVKATLVEGSARVTQEGKSVVLAPSQQAVAKDNQPITMVNDVNVDEVVAWKNEKFVFNSADIKEVMRQLARWYDVDVEYKDDISNHFTGIISRNVNASEVFTMLERTGAVYFEIEGNKMIVKKAKPAN